MAEPKQFTISSSYRGEDFYKELGLTRDADSRAIKKAYRERYSALHSDRLGNPAIKSADLDPFILEAFKNRLDRLSYAEAILTDEGTKDYYDRNYEIFQDDIADRKSRYAPEIRQQALDFNEAQRRLEQINNAYEKNRPLRELAQERRKQIAQTKRDLSDADKISGKEAELDALIQQIDDEIARYDKEVAHINEGFKKDTEARKEAEREAKNKEEEQRIPLLIKQWDAEAKHAQTQYRLATSQSEQAHWQGKIWAAYAEIERLQAEAAMKAGKEEKQEVFEDVSEEGQQPPGAEGTTGQQQSEANNEGEQQSGGEDAEGTGTPDAEQEENLDPREALLRYLQEQEQDEEARDTMHQEQLKENLTEQNGEDRTTTERAGRRIKTHLRHQERREADQGNALRDYLEQQEREAAEGRPGGERVG